MPSSELYMYMVTIRAIHWVPSGLVCLDPPPLLGWTLIEPKAHLI